MIEQKLRFYKKIELLLLVNRKEKVIENVKRLRRSWERGAVSGAL